ncbi:hypothetical protein GGR57DRAFT_32256 [Xylariaceae sp. FL1272]|nr:hypothetical protein GGR57DRAFT_32256 [Xylariaceae sp. FL1272]
MATMYDSLEPGGWVEFCEWIVAIQSPHNSLHETWFYRWAQHWEAGMFPLRDRPAHTLTLTRPSKDWYLGVLS